MAKAKTSEKSKSETRSLKRLVLLDSHAIIHRAYHALPDFSTSKGEPTGALYGLSTMLIKLIEDLKPDYLVAAFDLPEKTYRHEAYEAYKGKRKELDQNLVLQLERAKDVFRAWGIPIYSQPGFEADDVIGTIVEAEKKNKEIEIVIASGDMDTMQLVEGKRVRVYTLRKGLSDIVLYDEKKVVERFGFGPELLPDFKGLRGDPSDNIIGVPGIGEKTATTLVQSLGTVEKIYKALKKGGEGLGLTERVKNILLENEEEALFSKTLATIRRDAPINFKLPKPWRENLEIDKLNELYLELEFRTLPERVKRLLSSGSADPRALPSLRGLRRDSDAPNPSLSIPDDPALKLALWVVDSNITNPTMDDVFAFTKTKTLEEAWKVTNKELDARDVRNVFEEIEEPLIPIVRAMGRTGIKVDKKRLEKLSAEYHQELNKLEQQIWKLSGTEFNIASPKQLGEVLFEKLALGGKRQKKTATGSFSTKESELEKLRGEHPIIELILEYRELSKLLSTYIDTIPEQLDKDNRLHSTFILSGSTTGRMASQNPNLQNIPIRTELGRNIRAAFVADKGRKLLSLDYSQIELRIAAILSRDKSLIEIFKNGEDVHTGVAMRVFNLPADKIDKAMRIKAKTINFGVLFGMGVNALKTNLKTDRKDAQEFLNNYFGTFFGLAQYLDSTKALAQKQGYTTTLFGRRRYFSGLRSHLPYIKAAAERMAINAPIQGTEADIVKIAMKHLDNEIEKRGWREKVQLLLQVHDEIVCEVDEGLAHEVGMTFKKIMESVLSDKETYGVPIVAEANVGDNWNELERL